MSSPLVLHVALMAAERREFREALELTPDEREEFLDWWERFFNRVKSEQRKRERKCNSTNG